MDFDRLPTIFYIILSNKKFFQENFIRTIALYIDEIYNNNWKRWLTLGNLSNIGDASFFVAKILCVVCTDFLMFFRKGPDSETVLNLAERSAQVFFWERKNVCFEKEDPSEERKKKAS